MPAQGGGHVLSAAGPAAPDVPAGPVAPAAAPAPPAPPPAPGARRIALRVLGVLALVAADLWSKARVFAHLEALGARRELVFDGHGHPRLPLSSGEHDAWLALMLSENPGAAFGRLEDFPWPLVLGRAAASLFLLWMIARSAAGRPLFNLALVLVLAGALGNLHDNLLLDRPDDAHPFGLVRDFLDVYFGVWDWHFPTFNLADSCITVGAVLLLLSSLRGEGRGTGVATPEPRN